MKINMAEPLFYLNLVVILTLKKVISKAITNLVTKHLRLKKNLWLPMKNLSKSKLSLLAID